MVSTWQHCHGEGTMLQLGVCWLGEGSASGGGRFAVFLDWRGSGQLSGTWGLGPDPGQEKSSGLEA